MSKESGFQKQVVKVFPLERKKTAFAQKHLLAIFSMIYFLATKAYIVEPLPGTIGGLEKRL